MNRMPGRSPSPPGRGEIARAPRRAPPAQTTARARCGQHITQAVVVADLGVLVMGRRVRAWVASLRAWAMNSASSETKMPPPEVVMILLPLKE